MARTAAYSDKNSKTNRVEAVIVNDLTLFLPADRDRRS